MLVQGFMVNSAERKERYLMGKKQRGIKYLVGFSLVFVILALILSLRYWHQRDTRKYSSPEVSNYSRGSNIAPVVLKEFSDYQ